MTGLALNGITQFSVKPLRISVFIGFLMAGVGATYGIYALMEYFITRNTTTGWTSLIIIVLITSGVQLILLGVVGEYVGKMFMQTKNRPDYIVTGTNISDEEKDGK
jgi:dolichol-phosphate mannosyltransferase